MIKYNTFHKLRDTLHSKSKYQFTSFNNLMTFLKKAYLRFDTRERIKIKKSFICPTTEKFKVLAAAKVPYKV